MPQQLFANMYFDNGGSRLFGLTSPSYRIDDYIHNGQWFNRYGERIGGGDLSISDLTTIRDGLNPGELFIIVHELDSIDADSPLYALVEKAQYVISHRSVYLLEEEPTGVISDIVNGLRINKIRRSTAEMMINP